ncbi:MAG: methionyl aminopeptidase [Candidatus Aureabacteria bacterium]|nr:methionyl aminopeptidase [Candidatus Auribacterota bacterium]
MRREEKKRGRNDLCWCGSGKKYKKCHLAEDQNGSFSSSSAQGVIRKEWIQTPEEIEGVKKAACFNALLMDHIRSHVRAGISTEKLDDLIRIFTQDHGHIPACLNYKGGYPKSSCISVNEVVCHGIPKNDVILKEGDIVNIDITSIVNGFHGDQSETFLIGKVADHAKKLVIEAANAMIEGIGCVAPGVSFSKIGEVIEDYVERFGYSTVKDYTGHGIGKAFHEDPPIYHFRNTESSRYLMAPGMIFTVEPMVNEGTWKVELDRQDRWTVRTLDRKLSAQFEHTVLVTQNGFEILTLTPSQIQAGKICHLATHPNNISIKK